MLGQLAYVPVPEGRRELVNPGHKVDGGDDVHHDASGARHGEANHAHGERAKRLGHLRLA